MDKKVLVVGSINMDLLVELDEIPKLGETVLGNSLSQIPGGKGSNQAVAIARQGKKLAFLGKVGRDSFGQESLRSMEESGVDIGYIEKEESVSTGIALINVDRDGNNNIVVVPGANTRVDIDFIEEKKEVFKSSDIVLLQFEIPSQSVTRSLELAKKYKKTTIVNPAPARDMAREDIKNIDILIPNEYELERLAKVRVEDRDSLIKASNRLLDMGVKELIVTLGDRGVFYKSRKTEKFYPAYKVDVVDTTAAGDSFIGGFISEYMEEEDIEKAIDRGQKTAALTIQKKGAHSSIPNKNQVEEFHI